MTEQTFPFGGTAVADRPDTATAPLGEDGVAGENRRKLLIVVAAVGVLVVLGAAYFLLKSGGSSPATAAGVVPHHGVVAPAAGTPAAGAAAPVTLPRKVSAPEGRNPFKPLYVAPAAAAAPGTTSTTSTTSTGTGTATSTGTTQSTGTGTTTPPVASYHPVWIMLKSLTPTSATFDVGYSNGKTLRSVRYAAIPAPRSGGVTVFANTFALLGISNGQAIVKFGDGTPFRLDSAHNYMVVG